MNVNNKIVLTYAYRLRKGKEKKLMEKLYKDRLVGRLIAFLVAVILIVSGAIIAPTAHADGTLTQELMTLFRGLTPTQIDDAVADAKRGLLAETRGTKRNNLEKLFDNQIVTLKDRGTPEQIVNIFKLYYNVVTPKALQIWETKYPNETLESLAARGITLALPVIPRSFRSPYDLMAMIQNNGKAGYAYLKPTEISDVVDAPQEPYYIYDVEDGESTRGKSPQNAEKIFKDQARSPLTVAEITALATHTDVLLKYNVWATGSRFGSADGVPSISLDNSGQPRLGWVYVSDSHSLWGSASCGSRTE